MTTFKVYVEVGLSSGDDADQLGREAARASERAGLHMQPGPLSFGSLRLPLLVSLPQ